MDTPTNPTPSFVPVNLKTFRDRLAWTQAQLAEAAGISERTVQRAEDGESVSAETLSALAGALNVSLDDLRNAPKAEQELAAKYHVIKLARIARASDFRGLVPADALQIGYDGLTDEQEDAVAELEQTLRDLGDIWRDLEPVQQRQALKEAQTHVAALEAMGLVVTAGTDLLRLKTDDGKPFSMEVLHVVVAKADEPKLFALRDKTASVRLG
jgi:transcriptional regulator with XRE-family HTH domain